VKINNEEELPLATSKQKIEDMNLYQKFAKIRNMVGAVQKNRQGYGYTYADEEAILPAITAGMDKYHLTLFPGTVPGTTEAIFEQYTKTKTNKDRQTGAITVYEEKVNEYLVKSDMTFTWVNNDNPDDILQVPWSLVGCQTDASQAFGSGLTYSNRYFLLKFFNVATTNDDPDTFRSKQAAALAEEDRIATEGILDEIDRIVLAVLKKTPAAKADIVKMVKKTAGVSDYAQITKPTVAVAVLDAIKDKYDKGE